MLPNLNKLVLSFLLMILSFACVSYAKAQSPETYVHPRAVALMPVFISETRRIMPQIEHYEYIPALAEQETCISMKHSKCFNSTAELKNSREQGVGLFQLTRAWNINGGLRFDNLTGLRDRYQEELKELSWLNVKKRPDLQIRSALLLLRSSYPKYITVTDSYERLKFLDAAYNGGDRDTVKARSICNLTKGCNSQLWFNNVERFNPKSSKPVSFYGGRSYRDINNEHVRNIFTIRIRKYKEYLDEHYPDRRNPQSSE